MVLLFSLLRRSGSGTVGCQGRLSHLPVHWRQCIMNNLFFGSGTDLMLLVVLVVVFFFFLFGQLLQKSLRLPPSFQIGSGWNFAVWQDCSLSKYASVDKVRLLIILWRPAFKMPAMTSFHAEKCCYMVISHAASAWCIYSSVRQFLLFYQRFNI